MAGKGRNLAARPYNMAVQSPLLSFGLDLPQGASLTGGLDRSLTFGTGGSDLSQ